VQGQDNNRDPITGKRIVSKAVVMVLVDDDGGLTPAAEVSGNRALAMWGLSAIVEGMLKVATGAGNRGKEADPSPAPSFPPPTEGQSMGEVN